ncbi:MAG: ABC transporter substrate-binding protein [Acidobacteria bacterium]|nr:MAG: ABC transporter substrate-binding protein [Acidobacteriota bacterium]TDI44584.1 MAG: ABC transporter substrate-binding protein [Acidobacteriota bacterium]
MVTATSTLKLAHSPDSDDAFMFYALANNKVDAEGLEFTHILRDIETLNRMARDGEVDVTAMSVHAYAYLADDWALLSSGASMGDRYGPVLVARSALSRTELKKAQIAIPGEMTSAFLGLRLALGEFEYEVMAFDEILEAVADGRVDAGLVIHEGQLTYRSNGLVAVLEMGKWWYEETGLPLPLGVNAVARKFPLDLQKTVDRVLKRSIVYGLEHREEALEYAMRFARGLKPHLADRFVGMYVNHHTVDYGGDGKEAIRRFLRRGHEAGVLPRLIEPEFVSGE